MVSCPISIIDVQTNFGVQNLKYMKHLSALCVLICAVFAAWAQPQQQWSTVYTIDTVSYESTKDMAVDANGNIYQLMQTEIYPPGALIYKPVIRKVSPNGTVIWSTIYTHGGANDITFNSMGIDATGSIYVAGQRTTPNPNTAYYWYVAKFDNDGTFQWEHELSDVATENRAHKLIIHNNAIYVAGYTYNVGDGVKTILVKLDASGNETWKRYMDCTTSWDETPLQITASGNIVTGCTDSLVVLQPDGSHYAAADSSLNIYGKVSVAVDNNDNMYTFNWQSFDYMVRKFDANGNLLWETDSLGNYPAFGDWQVPLVTDDNGNVYAGSIVDSQTGMDSVYIYKLDGNGAIVWRKLLDFDPVNLIYRNNKLYVAGSPTYVADGKVGILQIDPVTANIDWMLTLGDSVWTQEADKLVIDNNGNFVFASRVTGKGYWDVVLTRYTANATGIEEINQADFNIYPNPVSDHLVINASISTGDITIQDMRGRTVATHVLNTASTILNVTNLSSGIYILKLGNTAKRFVKN